MLAVQGITLSCAVLGWVLFLCSSLATCCAAQQAVGWYRAWCESRNLGRNTGEVMRFQNLVLAAALFALAAADRARADNVYYAGNTNGSSYSFGTVNSAGQTTVIGTGLSFGGAGRKS